MVAQKIMVCKNCGANEVRLNKRTKIVSPNVYHLANDYKCKACNFFKREDLGLQDKNNEDTKELLKNGSFKGKT